MNTCHLDLETRSAVDLKACGVYVYAAHESTDVWCACFAFDDGPVQVWTPDMEPPYELFEHVLTGGTITCHNAAFERTLWRYVLAPRYGWPMPQLEQFRCTMIMAYAMGLPGSLEMAGAAVGLEGGKDMTGKRVMMQLAKPRKVNKDGSIVWWDDPEKIQRLIDYCKVDVEVERQIDKRILPLIPSELKLWHLDQRINDRGVKVDTALAAAAAALVGKAAEKLNDRMREVTEHEVTACSNVNQITAYLARRGVPTDNLRKDTLEELLAIDSGIPDDVRTVIELRRDAARASVAKINALVRGMSPEDGRTKGLLQFHAASTGRWCLAEGSMVTVRANGVVGEKPIEAVQLTDEVWDGHGWAAHEGVVFSGEKPVIAHGGVTATAEHKVYVSDEESMPLGQAKAEGRVLWRGQTNPT